MLKGYTSPRTPRGQSCLAPPPPSFFDHPCLELIDLRPAELKAPRRG